MDKYKKTSDKTDVEDMVNQFLQSNEGKQWLGRCRKEGCEGWKRFAPELQKILASHWHDIGKNLQQKLCKTALRRIKEECGIKQEKKPGFTLPKEFDEETLGLEIINNYPRPIAYAYHRMVNKAKTPRERFDGLLDTAESLAHTLTALTMGLYLKRDPKQRDAKWDQKIFQTVFVKGKLSFGDWVGLAIGTAKRISPVKASCENMLAFLLSPEVADSLQKLVEIRNDDSAHTGNRENIQDEILDKSMLYLQHLLAGAKFLNEIELLVPLLCEDKTIMRANKYRGIHVYPNKAFPNTGEYKQSMPTKRAIFAHFKKGDIWISLYPWLSWHDSKEGEGAYCLSQVRCLIDPPQRRVKSARYRAYESELNEKQETKEFKAEQYDPETVAIQNILRLLEIPFGINVRSFTPPVPLKLPKKSTIILDLVKFFKGRYIKEPQSWNREICEESIAFIKNPEIKKLPRPIRVFFDTHLSIAFLFGHIVNPKWGGQFLPTQKNSNSELGYDDWPEPDHYASGLWEASPWPTEEKSEIAIGLSIRNPVDRDVDAYLKKQSMDMPRIFLQPKGNTGQIDSEKAWQLAHDLNQTLRRRLPADCRKMHLFFSSPVAFAYILGQKLRYVTPEIQIYEYDFEGKGPDRYFPSITIQ